MINQSVHKYVMEGNRYTHTHRRRGLAREASPEMLPFEWAGGGLRMQGHGRQPGTGRNVCRVGLGSIDSISTWFGVLVSMSLRSSGPKTHAGLSLSRKRFGFDQFGNVSVWI